MTGEGKLSTPFQLADRVHRELMRRAEVNGSRSIDWDLQSFDRVGGRGTLRRVWDRLKGEKRIRGRKRGSRMCEGLGERRKKFREWSEGDEREMRVVLPELSSSSGSESDSGMSETLGQVTSLCLNRRPEHVVSSGVVTVTQSDLPITLGFSDASVSSCGWEEIYDLDGNPTGVEVLEIGVKK